LFVPSYSGTKQNFFIFKKWYQNKTKTFQIAPGFLKDRTKLLVVYKKFWKRTRTKAFGQKILVLNKNILFRSRILFQKRIHSIFFGTKAAKQKLPILKERWFDIATLKMFKKKIFCSYNLPTGTSISVLKILFFAKNFV
jgi:hypothetical protein